MLNSAVIDVGIALVYVFVLVSVLVSALNEAVAGLLKQRAKALWHGIAELVRSDSLRDAFYNHPLIKSLAPPMSGAALTPARMAGPSYIPKRTFALAILDLLQQPHAKLEEAERVLGDLGKALRGGNQPTAALATPLAALAARMPDTTTGRAIRDDLTRLGTRLTTAGVTTAELLPIVDTIRTSLPARLSAWLEEAATGYSKELGTIVRVLAEDTAGSIERLRTSIEEWFDTGMDRVAGWYKRWSQLWQFAIGLALAVVLNINIVAIANTLWTNIPLRAAIVGEAEKFAKNPPPGLWVTDPGKSEGDFAIKVTAPGLSKDAERASDRVLVQVVLGADAKEDTAVTLKVTDDAIRLEKAVLTIPKGARGAEVGGTVKAPQPNATLEASYTSEEGGKRVTKTATRTVAIDSDPGTRMKKTAELLSATRLPIGWPHGWPTKSECDWTMIPGWLLTALGASVGAPFWFDLLNRFVQLRAGGPKPDTKPDAKKPGEQQAKT